MPVERQAERLRTPLGARDKRFLAAVAAAGVIAAIAGGAFALTRGHSAAGRCITFTVPSSMGGATQHYCGAAARRFCLTEAGGGDAILACRRAGFSVG